MPLMHNSEYSGVAVAFRQAREPAPAFGMAYWGNAMSHYRPWPAPPRRRI